MNKGSALYRLVNHEKFPYFIFFLGVCYLAFLASSIQPDVFMQGDGGMKFIVIKQLVAGEGFKILTLPHAQWVHDVWNQGYFPIKIPFLYDSPQGRVIVFPPGFQLVSYYLYKQFGYIGLYIIPLTCTVLLWYSMLRLLRYAGVGPAINGLALFTLIFCTPLTIYGVTYWEHMPAACLLMCGLIFLVRTQTKEVWALLLGFTCAAATWLRPEALVLNLFFTIAVLIQRRQHQKPAVSSFLMGQFVSIVAFFVFNKWIYGHWLGAHGNQVMEVHSWGYKILRAGKYDLVLNWMLVKFFTVILLLPVALYCWYKLRWRLDLRSKYLFGIIIAFCSLAAIMFPNTGGGQWGPRYLMVIVPAMILLLAFLGQQWLPRLSRNALIGIFVFILLANLWSMYENVYRGGMIAIRYDNRNRIAPALDFVRHQPDSAIVVNIEHITMEMGAIFKERNIFLAESDSALQRFIPALDSKGQKEFLYICDHNDPPGMPNLLNNLDSGLVKHGKFYFGRYMVAKH